MKVFAYKQEKVELANVLMHVLLDVLCISFTVPTIRPPVQTLSGKPLFVDADAEDMFGELCTQQMECQDISN
jgi:hypothetical protein